ncbi:NAD(P)H-hydrate dehydratase [Jiella avicenniae]|uniref:Bifunctional NAD(P)H-hydrate repair enzyme n=1 Tax=Jiella avicenniae TaxID=2907202 RepID=A0A9X1TBC8_9HYPH|nr:NAD(P)H-hydrate dehydratase [Jiella avicenniae]MCE7028033.1 NAD(P)H-hydrate dehydratase [Jiella avicenniae]
MAQNRASDAALLTPREMGEADRRTISAGTPGIVLMERAATAIAAAAIERFPAALRIALLAGPGNNGGDAYAAAAILLRAGRDVRLFHLGPPGKLSGDAAIAAAAYHGPAGALSEFRAEAFDLVVDGLFGAGLSRPLEGEVAEVVTRLKAAATPVLAVDLPSGISGETGAVLGAAVAAEATVTFFRKKPGHLVEPGRSHCGAVIVADIGISDAVLSEIGPRTFETGPALWHERLVLPSEAGHKYDRGHAVVFSGGASQTGAARLSATAALRAGAGLVTVFSPASALLVNAAHLTAVMLKRCEDAAELEERLGDGRLNAFVLGPGFGQAENARAYAQAVLAAGRRLVLDADGITAFQDDPATLFDAAGEAGKARADGEPALVLTPHAGEFKRLFPDLAAADDLSKPVRARQAAARSNAVVVLKGRDTVIAAPDGRAAINASGTPWLATAGTGDVLTGIVAAQLAQGTPSFEAAAAGVWMHGKAAEAFGPGLIAEDLPTMLPRVFALLAGG